MEIETSGTNIKIFFMYQLLDNDHSMSVVIMSAREVEELVKNTVSMVLKGINHNADSTVAWLNSKQVADRLGVDLSTLWRWEKEGYIRAERFGRKVRFKESEVLRVEEAEKKGGSNG